MMISCTNKDKPLVLSWGRTPRLNSGVRVSEILGFPSISHVPVSGPKWGPCLAKVRSNRVLVDVSSLPRMFLGPQKAQRPEMDLLYFVRTADPTKVRIGERQRGEDEPKLLDTTVGRVVSLLPVALARGESELKDSVDRLFDEEGNDGPAEQGDSASGGQGVGIQPVSEAAETNIEDVVLRRQEKTSVAGKSMSVIQRLLVRAVQNAAVRGEPIPSLPFITSYVSTTPEYTEADSLIRSSAPAMTTATTVTVTAGAATVVKETVTKPSLFATGSSSVGGTKPIPDVYVPRWNVTNGSRLDDNRDFCEMGDDFAPPKFFASVCGMEHDQLFAEFNVGVARQMILSVEVRMRAEYNIEEKRRLKYVVDDQAEVLKDEIRSLKERNASLEKEKGELEVTVVDLAALVKVREQEAAALDVVVTTVKLQNDRLVDQVHELETSSAGLREKVAVYENCMSQLEKFQDERMKEVNDKFDKLDVDVIEMALHLEERFYPHLLTTIVGRRWLLTHGIKLSIAKCLHSLEYLSALGAAISRAIEKGMQDGLAAEITHGQEGRVLSDVAAFNPSAESDYISALQELQDVNFSLLAELKSNKDASIETLMNILRLEEPVAERLGLQASQPHEDQLMVPIHHSPDQTVMGATSLSFSLDVSRNRAQKIRDNIANHRSALRDVFVSIVEPLSSVALEGTEGTSGTVPETTTALSVIFTHVSSIPPIFMDDYEIAHADDQGNVGANVDPFPNVDDAELIIS
ncbi:hypothetical protein Tco_0571755 [Tanacetum coccineum]